MSNLFPLISIAGAAEGTATTHLQAAATHHGQD